MAYLNLIGFETGDLSESNATSGVTVQGVVKRTGAYALRANQTGSGSAYYQFGQPALNGSGTNFAVNTAYYRFYFRVDTLPASASEEIFSANYTTQRKFSIRITSAGKLQAYDKSGTTQLGTDGTTVLSTGVWYRIEAAVGTGATAAYEVLIDGNSELSGTGDLYTSNNSLGYLGKVTNRNGNTVDFYFDDVAVSDTAYPGPGQCVAMKPNGDGNYTTWTIGAGAGNKWDQVKEVPPDGDTTYLLSTLVANQAYTAALESSATAGISGTIHAAKAINILTADASGASSRTVLRSSSTDSITTTLAYSPGTYIKAEKFAATDPATGVAWTTGGLDGAEVGCVERSTTAKTRLTACYLMVDFDPPAGTSYTETGSGVAISTASGAAQADFVAAGSSTAISRSTGADVSDFITAGSAVSILRASGADVYTPYTPQNYVETGSGVVLGVGSASTQSDFITTGAGRSVLAASGAGQADFIAAGSARSVLSAGGAEVANFVATGSGVIVSRSSGADVSAWTTTGSGVVISRSSGADVTDWITSGKGVAVSTGSGADVADWLVSGSGRSILTGSGADLADFISSGSGVSVLRSSGADLAAFVSSGSGVSDLQASGADVYTQYSGGANYVETGSGVAILRSSGTAQMDWVTSGSAVSVLRAGGVDVATWTVAGSGVTILRSSGAAVQDSVESGTGRSVLSASGSDRLAFSDSGSGESDLQGSGDDVFTPAVTGGADGSLFKREFKGMFKRMR